jgi:hypothetical protein
VRTALEKDGWTITHDPLIIRWGKRLKLLIFDEIEEVILRWIV